MTHETTWQDDMEGVRKTAREMLTREFVVFDTETTGLGRDARIVAIAVIDQTGKTLVDTLINPGVSIPADAARIHGITDEMVKDAPGFLDVWSQINSALHLRAWCGYNCAFDEGLLASECSRCGVEMPTEANPNGVDVMTMYAVYAGEWNNYHGDYRWQKLAHAKTSLPADQRTEIDHSALDDALNTLALLKFLAAAGDASEKQG